MCGIMGVIKPTGIGLTKQDIDLFQSMLTISETRGIDSTGIFWSNKKLDKIEHYKDKSCSSRFVASEGWKNIRPNLIDTPIIVGHCRSATVGSVSKENAHPFVVGDTLALVHNGTLAAVQDDQEYWKYKVDSEWIAHRIYQGGYKEIENIRGDMALVWMDLRNKSLGIFRNLARPLFLYQDDERLVLASNELFIHAALLAQGIDVKPKEIYSLLDDNYCRVEIKTKDLDFFNIKIKSKEPIKVVDKSYQYWNSLQSRYVPKLSTESIVKDVKSEVLSDYIKIVKKKNKVKFVFNEGNKRFVLEGIEKEGKKLPYLQQLTYRKDSFFSTKDKMKVEIRDIESLQGMLTNNNTPIYLVSSVNFNFPDCEFISYVSKWTDLELIEMETLIGTVGEIRLCTEAEFAKTGFRFSAELDSVLPAGVN